MRERSQSLGRSTIGKGKHTLFRRSGNPEFGKAFSRGSVKARFISFISEHEPATMRSIRPIPFAFFNEIPPKTASIVWDLSIRGAIRPGWNAGSQQNALNAPMSIYEMHVGSWKRVPEEGNRSLSYRELAELLAGISQADGVHPCGVSADHGSSVFWFMGIPDHGIFRSDRQLWHAPGFHVSGR